MRVTAITGTTVTTTPIRSPPVTRDSAVAIPRIRRSVDVATFSVATDGNGVSQLFATTIEVRVVPVVDDISGLQVTTVAAGPRTRSR
jgi:hypothetical protein